MKNLYQKNLQYYYLEGVALTIFGLIIFSAFLIPEIFAYLHLDPFTWQNAWDKCTYLSYQGILGTLHQAGYTSAYLVKLLQGFGMAGSIQALFFDLIFPALITFLAYRIFVLLKIEKTDAFFYSLLVIFSSVLFSYTNPHIANHFNPPLTFRFFSIGWATFPTIIRSPNPQLSYFLLALCLYLFFHYKRKIFLILPLPFLYYFVFIPYLYLLAVAFFQNKILRHQRLATTLSMNAIVYISIACFVWILFMMMGTSAEIIKRFATLYHPGRYFHLNLVGSTGIVIYIVLKLFGVFHGQKNNEHWLLSLILCSFAITNLQLINGFALDLKSYQDLGNNIVGGLILVLSHYSLKQTSNRFYTALTYLLKYTLLFFIAKYVLLSQGFNFNSYNFNIHLGAQVSKEQFNKITADPLHAIILDQDLAEYLPFSHDRMLASVFAYEYNYPFIEKQCQYNFLLAENALAYIRKNCDSKLPACADIERRAQLYFSFQNRFKDIPYHNQAYCDKKIYANKDFYFISPDKSRSDVIFPDWKDLLKRMET